MLRIRSAVLVICMLLLSAMAVTACGGDDSDDSVDAGNGAEASATEATDEGSSPDEVATTPAEEATTPADDDDDQSGGGEVVSDPCSLLTQSEVEAALGESVQAPVMTYSSTANLGTSDAQATVGTCNYVAPTGLSSISLTVWSAPGEEGEIEAMVELACTGKETISGLGDLACWYDDQHLEVQLASGSAFLDIFATTSGDATEVLETLSETAVGRLQ